MEDFLDVGQQMYHLATRLYPICRSITGNGVRESLRILNDICEMEVIEVPSGTEVFDWTVPKEWNITEAYIETLAGERVIDFKQSNLHVVGYSLPVDKIISREELYSIIYVDDKLVDAIPYVTSYYKERYGFCMSKRQKENLKEDKYHIVIKSEMKNGYLTYGEIKIPGESEQEVFLSTYVCHPSMANNELSGPCLAIYLAKELKKLIHRRYSYRIIFIPETIGSITYLSKNYLEMRQRTVAGFNISCVGDDRTYSYIASRYGNTLADRAAKNVLKFHYPEYKEYSFLERGSDERQYCAPGIDLPLCGICRSKYGEYPEYHTSRDDLTLISAGGLAGAFEVYWKILMALENNFVYTNVYLCEPQLGKRGLYPSVSKRGIYDKVKALTNFIAYADGNQDLIQMSDIINVPMDELIVIAEKLERNGIIRKLS